MELCLKLLILSTVALSLQPEPGKCRVLNDFIRHFEPVDYDYESLMWQHHRLRRSVAGPRHVELHFTAFGRRFDLMLEPETRLFHPKFTVTMDGQEIPKHNVTTFMYSGTDRNNPRVHAYGNLAHNVFDGTIETENEVYHVEPTFRYHSHLNENDTFHTLVYRQSDLDLSSMSSATCGSSHVDIQRKMLQVQRSHSSDKGWNDHILKKRQGGRDRLRIRCWLGVVLDYKLYEVLADNMENPAAVLLNMIRRGSSIFEGTDFDSDGVADNIHFGIRNLTIESQRPSGFFGNDFIGVSAFLNQHSQANYSDFCLTYRFTYRDFDQGVVGLAYIAPQPGVRQSGGVCQRPERVSGGVRTLNTGIVTSLNYGRRIPPSLSALTFAHEAGHNFGSNHDTGDPPALGAYIMHAYATDGSQSNNDKFSPASRMMMNPVIGDRGQGPGGCFEEGDDLCGNNLVDPGEECDCGPPSRHHSNGTCKADACCFGRNCSLNPNVQCSPDQGPCCSSTCMFIQQAENRTCSLENDCALNQTCGGMSAECPIADARDPPSSQTFLLCDNDQGVCNGPSCNGTVCIALNLTQCECSNVTQACHVCCVLDGVCTSTIQIADENIMGLRNKLPGQMGRNVQVGRPCANFTGYCDFLNSCMLANENGALFRLANLIFNSPAFRRFLDFIIRMWWVVVVTCVGVLVILFFVVLLIHCVLPRPEHVRSREYRRSTLLFRRPQRPGNQQRSGGRQRVASSEPDNSAGSNPSSTSYYPGTSNLEDIPPVHYPQNYPLCK